MIARLSIPERAELMREYRDKLLELSSDIDDVICGKLAPFDKRNYESGGYTAEDVCSHSKPYDDKDAPLMTRIFTVLDKAYEELNERCKELDAEEAERYEAYEMFFAWELGLCPYVMREHRRKRTPYVWNSLKWEAIAGFLKGTGMSRERTEEAVREYLRDKNPECDRVIAAARESIRIKKTA